MTEMIRNKAGRSVSQPGSLNRLLSNVSVTNPPGNPLLAVLALSLAIQLAGQAVTPTYAFDLFGWRKNRKPTEQSEVIQPPAETPELKAPTETGDNGVTPDITAPAKPAIITLEPPEAPDRREIDAHIGQLSSKALLAEDPSLNDAFEQMMNRSVAVAAGRPSPYQENLKQARLITPDESPTQASQTLTAKAPPNSPAPAIQLTANLKNSPENSPTVSPLGSTPTPTVSSSQMPAPPVQAPKRETPAVASATKTATPQPTVERPAWMPQTPLVPQATVPAAAASPATVAQSFETAVDVIEAPGLRGLHQGVEVAYMPAPAYTASASEMPPSGIAVGGAASLPMLTAAERPPSPSRTSAGHTGHENPEVAARWSFPFFGKKPGQTTEPANASSKQGSASEFQSIETYNREQAAQAQRFSPSPYAGKAFPYTMPPPARVPLEPWAKVCRFVEGSNKTLDDTSIRYISAHIVGLSEYYQVDYRVIASVISIESSFRHDAISRTGAMGMGQLKADTAKWLGVSDPWDPVQNMNGTTKYLKWLHEHYKGDWDAALSAYFVGQGTIDRAGGKPTEASLPYLFKIRDALTRFRPQVANR